ncbi:MAG: Kelch repeat-containing protein [Chloroflexota bacterium]
MKARLLSGVAVAVAVGAVAVPAVLGAEPAWRQLAPAPEPRQEVTYVALGGKLYLAAGNNLSQQRYDPETDSWSEVAELPAEFTSLDHVAGVAVGSELVYTGGLSKWEYPFPVSGETTIYDPVGDSFSAGADMPSPRAAGGAAVWHGKLIYAGGLGPEGSVARVDAYDPATDEWTRLANMPRPRDHFQAVIVGDELYAIGGRRTTGNEGRIEVEDLKPVDVLDLPASDAELATAAWTPAVTSIPTDRGGLGVAAVGTCIYAIGGERATGPDEVTGAVESYDTASGEWHSLPPLPLPRHGIEAATIGKTIYVAGGGTVPFDYAPTDASEALDVEDTGPCAAVAEPEPGPPDATEEPPVIPPETEHRPEVRITHLAVQPQRVVLRKWRPDRRRPRVVVRLSREGWVTLRLPGRFRLNRLLHAGRNELPLPVGPHRRLLPRGSYRLLATPRSARAGGKPMQAAFRIVR